MQLQVIMQDCRTIAEFRTKAFNTTVTKPHFINPGSFGDDLLQQVSAALRALGVRVAQAPEQEDFGWFIIFEVDGDKYCFVVGWQPGDDTVDGKWIGEVERSRGLLGSRLERRENETSPKATSLIHEVLSRLSDVQDLAWYRRSGEGEQSERSAHPNSP
ncbi:MAG: hypothetical protein QM756_18670 [Polyangiaceae bacterium]